jgi:hypothetical protein
MASRSTERAAGKKRNLSRRIRGLAGCAAALVVGITPVLIAIAIPASPASASTATAHAAPLGTTMTWQQVLPDGGSPIAESSPSVATLDGGGPSVVVGDRAGNLWAFHLSDGSTDPGWPAHTGVPIDSTPSVIPNGSGTDNVFIGGGNAGTPSSGGYYGFSNSGGQLWHTNASDAVSATHGVQASLSTGLLNGVPSVVAPSLGQNEYALNTSNGSTLPGWPFFTADSGFGTPALADLYGNGQTDVV